MSDELSLSCRLIRIHKYIVEKIGNCAPFSVKYLAHRVFSILVGKEPCKLVYVNYLTVIKLLRKLPKE